MSAKSSPSSNGGVGVTGLLGVAFVVLKLTHVIDWSWWWVTAPFWAGLPLAALTLVVGLLCVIVKAALVTRAARRKAKEQAT